MPANDIGIDMGTSSCLVYSTGKGLILKEPTVVVYDKDTEKIKAIGEEAKQMAALPRIAEILFLPFGSRRRFTRNSRIHQVIRPSSVIVRVRSSEYL